MGIVLQVFREICRLLYTFSEYSLVLYILTDRSPVETVNLVGYMVDRLGGVNNAIVLLCRRID